jgi:putative DNA primase/helicase
MLGAADRPPRPVPLPVSPTLIPEALRALPQWVTWRYTWKPDQQKWDKPPRRATTGKPASSTNPKTWSPFETALQAYHQRDLDGIGLAVIEANSLVGIDLDHCRNADDGEIEPWAVAIVQQLQTYSEVSPSGTGLRLWALGQLPPGGRKKGDIELYSGGRYLTVTGNHLQDTPLTIEPRQADLDALHTEVFGQDTVLPPRLPPAASNGHTPPLDDDVLLERALAAKNGEKFARLWAGDISDYKGDDSRADLGFCGLLAFWTCDASQLDRLFRRSGLMRSKWDELRGEQTYGGRTITRALAEGRETWQPGQGRSHPNGDQAETAAPDDTPHLTDRGNAIRLVRQYGPYLHYVRIWHKWLLWREGRWLLEDGDLVMHYAKQVIAGLYDWAASMLRQFSTDLDGDNAKQRQQQVEQIEAVLRWALKSESTPRLDAMVKSAISEPGIALDHSQLDAQPWLLNCRNGTIDLCTGILRPHRRQDLLTKQLPVVYDARATCPLWHRFLWRIMGGPRPDEDGLAQGLLERHERAERLIGFLQRAIGYTLTGVIRDHLLLFLYGTGANGKTTLLNTLLAMLGEYGMQARSDLLLVRVTDSHPTEHADLFGKRFVTTVEIEHGRRLAESLMKQFTGGERIRARRMREDFWEFDPTHTIWMAANCKPVVRGQDVANWRRIKVVPFEVTIPTDEQDKALPEKLLHELPGILAWAVQGCLNWQQDGLQEPQEVTDATDAYRREQDTLGLFLRECCYLNTDVKVQSSLLLDAYEHWSGEKIRSNEFSGLLENRGYRKTAVNGRVFWCGIGLPRHESDAQRGR